jgi:Family of unknown function (DUF5995)
MTLKFIDADHHIEAQRIPTVLDRLKEVQAAAEAHPLGRRDGVACFNYLYSVITGQVQRDYLDDKFADGDFITRLDVAFANRYLRGIDGAADAAPAPWRCLMESRSERRISPLAFAVVGVSAHVNYDLAFAVLETSLEMGRSSLVDRDDYDHLNQIFFREMRRLRRHFEDQDERKFEKAFGLTTLENLLGDIIVVVARWLAWRKAQRLWDARMAAGADEDVEDGTARWVGAFNRGVFVFDRTVRHAFTALISGGRRS